MWKDFSNSDWINLGLATITAIYALLTFGILWWNRRVVQQMEAQQLLTVRPYVLARIYLDQGHVFTLIVENVGKSAAENLSLTIDRDFYRLNNVAEENNLKNFRAFKCPIPNLQPTEKLSFTLSTWLQMSRPDQEHITPFEFEVTAKYKFLHREYEDRFLFDLKPYKDTAILRSDNSLELKQIREKLSALVDNVKVLSKKFE